jgi:hypothetical protein
MTILPKEKKVLEIMQSKSKEISYSSKEVEPFLTRSATVLERLGQKCEPLRRRQGIIG